MLSDAAATISSVAGRTTPSHRAKVIETLLERYNDLVDPGQMRDQPGDGTGLVLMPRTYTSSVKELERLIVLLRDDTTIRFRINGRKATDQQGRHISARTAWWHLNAWYIAVEKSMYLPPKMTVPKSKPKRRQLQRLPIDQDGRMLPQVRVSRAAGARQEIALKAVEWLSENWGLQGEPMLPRELVQAA